MPNMGLSSAFLTFFPFPPNPDMSHSETPPIPKRESRKIPLFSLAPALSAPPVGGQFPVSPELDTIAAYPDFVPFPLDLDMGLMPGAP